MECSKHFTHPLQCLKPSTGRTAFTVHPVLDFKHCRDCEQCTKRSVHCSKSLVCLKPSTGCTVNTVHPALGFKHFRDCEQCIESSIHCSHSLQCLKPSTGCTVNTVHPVLGFKQTRDCEQCTECSVQCSQSLQCLKPSTGCTVNAVRPVLGFKHPLQCALVWMPQERSLVILRVSSTTVCLVMPRWNWSTLMDSPSLWSELWWQSRRMRQSSTIMATGPDCLSRNVHGWESERAADTIVILLYWHLFLSKFSSKNNFFRFCHIRIKRPSINSLIHFYKTRTRMSANHSQIIVERLFPKLPIKETHSLGGKIGAGGFSEVYLAEDSKKELKLALKFLKPLVKPIR